MTPLATAHWNWDTHLPPYTHGTPNSVIQIASCFLCGAVAAVMLILWLRVGNDEKEFV